MVDHHFCKKQAAPKRPEVISFGSENSFGQDISRLFY